MEENIIGRDIVIKVEIKKIDIMDINFFFLINWKLIVLKLYLENRLLINK
jgi:hypothetical protein